MENLDPPTRQSRMEKGQVLAFARLHPCFWEDEGPTVPLHSVQD